MDRASANTATMATIQSVTVTNPNPSAMAGALPSPLAPLFEPHPTPRFYRSRLDRGMSVLQAVPECVVALVGEPGVGLTLEEGELRGQVRHLSGKDLGHVPMVAWSAHALRIRV